MGSGGYPRIDEQTKARLAEAFKQHKRQLESLVGTMHVPMHVPRLTDIEKAHEAALRASKEKDNG